VLLQFTSQSRNGGSVGCIGVDIIIAWLRGVATLGGARSRVCGHRGVEFGEGTDVHLQCLYVDVELRDIISPVDAGWTGA
jgi:hypothetical protein